MRQAIQGGPGGVRILQTVPVEGTAAEMAVDAAAIISAGTEVANQGKRWENTTDGLVYDFRPVGGSWGYYIETNADASGNIPVSSSIEGALTWGEGGTITVVAATTAADTGSIVTLGKYLDIFSDVECYVKVAAATEDDADASDYPLMANTLYRIPIVSGHALFAFRAVADAVIKYHPVG